MEVLLRQKKILKWLPVLALAAGGGDGTEPNIPTALKGTSWKLVGIVDAETNEITKLYHLFIQLCYKFVLAKSIAFRSLPIAKKKPPLYKYLNGGGNIYHVFRKRLFDYKV